MLPSTLIYMLQEAAEAVILVYLANGLGGFFDAVFSLNVEAGLAQMSRFLLCMLAGVFVLPFLSFLGEAVMIYNALKHDRLVLGRFLDKTYSGALSMSEGEVQYRLEEDPIYWRGVWQNTVTDTSAILAATAFLLISAVRISAVYTLVSFAVFLLCLAVPAALRKYRERYDKENREFNTRVGANENLLAHWPCEVKLYGMGEKLLERFEGVFRQYFRKLRLQNIRVETVADGISAIMGQSCTMVILLFGAWMVSARSITPGAVAAMIGYLNVFHFITDKISDLLEVLPERTNLMERMKELYRDAERVEGKTLDGRVTGIAAEGLQFTYRADDNEGEDGRTRNVDYPDFRLKEGEKLRLSGPNGSGKTTLLKLLCGLLGGYRGRILINGAELGDYNIEDVRKHIAYVEQSPYLFQGTVLENICTGDLRAGRESARKLAEELGIAHLLERTVSGGAGELSGGEKQRIALARALMKPDAILLMDEPDNHLDEDSLEWLKDFIAHTQRTMIYVTHGRLTDGQEAGAKLPASACAIAYSLHSSTSL